ncbi:HAD family hydrolase [Photobacterium kagoshimensis]|uniref:HAD family hydrolase n=1 Tax=Photobacterium kagoshimensis TaxID=2910242 RepID=UPI003D144C62
MLNKIVIFDLDDTIYPESSYNLACYQAASKVFLADYGVDLYSEIELRFNQRQYRDLFSRAIKAKGGEVSEEYIFTQLVQAYRTHAPELKPYDGFLSCILELKSRYRLAIITDGNSSIQRQKIQALGIAPYFDFILCSSELGKGISKPMALPYEKVLNFFGVSPQDSVYIGDNQSKDFIYPNQVGMHSIHLLNLEENSNLIYYDAVGQPARHLCYSYSSLMKILSELWMHDDSVEESTR